MKDESVDGILHQRPEKSAKDKTEPQGTVTARTAFTSLMRKSRQENHYRDPNKRDNIPVGLGKVFADFALEKARLPVLWTMHPVLILVFEFTNLKQKWLSSINGNLD